MTKLLDPKSKTANDVAKLIESRKKSRLLKENRKRLFDVFPKGKARRFLWILLFLICVLWLLFGCRKAIAWPDKFDTLDWAGQAIFTAECIVDWGQTNWMTRHYVKKGETGAYYEQVNPLFGRYPSRGQINWYFPTAIIAHAAVSYLLPKKVNVIGINIPTRSLWQFIWIGFEGNNIYRNYRIGLGFQF
jgi:hypothetical protein